MMSHSGATASLSHGTDNLIFSSDPSGTYAWTSLLAQQSLQPDFDPLLVRMFDRQALGSVSQSLVASGEGLSVSIDGSAAQAIQGALSSPFGFADFMAGDNAVRVARPVAVAETAGGLNDTTAIVRVRQGGEDSLALSFHRVDDLTGKITGLSPGDAGYAVAAEARAYHTTTGATEIRGPGYGNYEQAGLVHVNAGDLIAMKLVNNTSHDTFWAFARANETVNGQHVGHLVSFGLNTWGWEDTRGGGDHDFNDLVVQFDFTSAGGHGWLV
jgi:hypothetical protein